MDRTDVHIEPTERPGGLRTPLAKITDFARGRPPLERSAPNLDHGPTCIRSRRFASYDALPPAAGEWKLTDGEATLIVEPPDARPPREARLWIMSYNVLLSGIRREALLEYFERIDREDRLPDVVALQESNLEIAVLLARRYGFRLAYYGQDFLPPKRRVNGKAVLSRHPIVDAEHFTYFAPDALRHDAREAGGPDTLEEDRGALHAAIEVEGRSVHLFNVHHSVGNPLLNAQQLMQLLSLARAAHPSIALGDFNANINLKEHHSHWSNQVPRTDTVEDYEQRYGNVWSSVGEIGTGNIADARLRGELHRLEKVLADAVAVAPSVQVRVKDNELMLPAEARKILDQHQVERGSETWRRLRDIADVSTLSSDPDPSGVVPSTGKRFDGFFASRELKCELVEIDRSTEGSDHQPVIAWYAR